jgi:hypothetical protein
VVATLDARAGRLRRAEDVETTAPNYEDRFPKTNPATGPIAIEGAEPGDVVSVGIKGIELESSGYTLVKPGFGVVPDMVERPVARICPIVDGALHFGALRVPIRPMIGVIATAPPGEPQGTAFWDGTAAISIAISSPSAAEFTCPCASLAVSYTSATSTQRWGTARYPALDSGGPSIASLAPSRGNIAACGQQLERQLTEVDGESGVEHSVQRPSGARGWLPRCFRLFQIGLKQLSL